jgi:phosphoribosylformylglycinamidine cyclo-ligase
MRPGDWLVALPSSGPHTNGYSLIRRVLAGRDLDEPVPGDAAATSLLDALLAPHRAYLADVSSVRNAGLPLLGMAHITGGGLYENLPRVLPEGLHAQIDLEGWETPPLFVALVGWANMSLHEAYRVFNMGIGMVLILRDEEDALARLQALLPEARPVGRLVPGERGVSIRGVDEIGEREA